MKKLMLVLGAWLGLGGLAQAQAPAMTQEQAQQLMLRQMQMMSVLFESRQSKLDFDATVATLKGNAGKHGWKTPEVHDVQAAMKQAGATDAQRMKAVATCPPNANERLAKASGGKLPPLPCRYTVFEGQDGKIYVVRMNTPVLAKTMQGEAAKVMQDIAVEEDAVLKGIVN